MEYVGPDLTYAVAAVDLRGDEPESVVGTQLRGLEQYLSASDSIVAATLTVSQPPDLDRSSGMTAMRPGPKVGRSGPRAP